MNQPTLRVAAYSHVHGFDVFVVPTTIPVDYYGEMSSEKDVELLRGHGIDFEPHRGEYIDVIDLVIPPEAIPKPHYVVIVWDEDMALVDVTRRIVLASVSEGHYMSYPLDVPSTTIRDSDIPNPEELGAPNWGDVLNNLDTILKTHPPYSPYRL